MTATQESVIRNTRGGDRDSAGVFQQRPSQGWGTYAQVTDVAHAAGKFFGPAVKAYRADPRISLNDLCQHVQKSGTPNAYGQWESEATRTVDAFTGGAAQSFTGTGAHAQSRTRRYAFQRGQNGKRENTWDCLGRLMDEVGWRRFAVRNTLYLISEEDLFASRPRLTVSESLPWVDSIDGSILMGRKRPAKRDDARNPSVGELTVACRADRWVAPPGSTVMVEEMGPFDGRWLVTGSSRGLFSRDAQIQLRKPIAALPEPAPETVALTAAQSSADPGAIDTSGLEQVQAGQTYRSPITGRTYAIPAEHAPNLVWWNKGSIAIAKWMAPQLIWARQHGWDGQITSGFRTFQHQVDSQGAAVAAAPGHSNHEGSQLPRGAIDTPSYRRLRVVLQGWRGPNTLVGGGAVLSNDVVHFSKSGS